MPPPDPPLPVEALQRALLEHYDRAGRTLPWRGEADPYRILVSEVMLQQTRVETVKKYYGRWLERFPDVASLAEAEEDEVLKLWEGLGYYRRARNLHRTARVVRERADGTLPSDLDGLRTLPGIGEYTAGAVASIAFGEVAPAVDGNVRRVLSRFFDVPEPKAAWLRDTATELVDPERPGDWNQALMELGATVCTPRSPGCDACPVAGWCRALAEGTVPERPTRKAKGPVPTAYLVLGVFRFGDRVLLVKRPAQGLLGGMWAFPEVEIALVASAADALPGLTASLGLHPTADPTPLPRHEHRFTHLHAIYLPWSVSVREDPPTPEGRWLTPDEARSLALPVAQRRVLESSLADAPEADAPGAVTTQQQEIAL